VTVAGTAAAAGLLLDSATTNPAAVFRHELVESDGAVDIDRGRSRAGWRQGHRLHQWRRFDIKVVRGHDLPVEVAANETRVELGTG